MAITIGGGPFSGSSAGEGDVRAHREIPVPPNETPTRGCPKHWIRSTGECAGPLNHLSCKECPANPHYKERDLA